MPSYWPDKQQTLLLHAVLDEPEDAGVPVRRWLDSVDFEELDAGSQRLLPLLSARLKLLKIDHPLGARIKGFFRRAWYLDQRLRAQLRIVRTALAATGVPCILLKGAALGPEVYGHGAFRPADDIDLLIPREDFTRVCALMLQLGWKSDGTEPALFGQSETFTSDIGSVDLHISPFHETADDHVIDKLWADKRELIVDGAAASILSPHDQLLHTLTHGLRYNFVPPIRWIADAMLSIRRYHDLDWDRFVARAEALRYGLVASRGLAFLAEEFGAPVPPAVLQRLASQHRDLNEKIEFHFGRRGRFMPLVMWAVTYRQHREGLGSAARWRLVASQYRRNWGSGNLLEFVSRAGVRLAIGQRLTAKWYRKE